MATNMAIVYLFAFIATMASAESSTDSYKDQHCTDPRTMKKHAAYTEWADAYSCTRHRCQPGGRNLAIYTVGCKRVEAPESAIECEEVVEDTNMQFPFCCTRLRCLVVVRGEVWTRVLGQPWETLPAAPWSHMYKMKKPPPEDSAFSMKSPREGPVYELASDLENDKVLRTGKKAQTDNPECNETAPRAMPAPDIVIALSTATDKTKDHKKNEPNRDHKRGRKLQSSSQYFEDEGPGPEHHNDNDMDEPVTDKEKVRQAKKTVLPIEDMFMEMLKTPLRSNVTQWRVVDVQQRTKNGRRRHQSRRRNKNEIKFKLNSESSESRDESRDGIDFFTKLIANEMKNLSKEERMNVMADIIIVFKKYSKGFK